MNTSTDRELTDAELELVVAGKALPTVRAVERGFTNYSPASPVASVAPKVAPPVSAPRTCRNGVCT